MVQPGQRDITGQRFGKLVALYPTGERGRGGNLIWHCRCDCGGEVEAPLHQLASGYRKSCGCRQKTVYAENLKLIDGTPLRCWKLSGASA